ncbi:hypothetical protein JTB14_031623 [Gonioctena quinquepunctata]|nr:hypothetical protein JTB14_031623 [Gonioctena quinquepunctata]
MTEREIRRKNVIIFGLPEADNSVDKNTASEIINATDHDIDQQRSNNIKVFRIGHLNANANQPRPLKIILLSPEDAMSIKFRNLNITSDKTPTKSRLYKSVKQECPM